MENENFIDEAYKNEIGFYAKSIDTEMSIYERMKIKKSTVFRIFGALGIYALVMGFLTFIL